MNVLVAVAHPDDEGLGAGGTIARLVKAGYIVDCLILSGGVDARTRRPSDSLLAADISAAKNILGIRNLVLGDFPNIKFNTVAHLDLTQFIEKHIKEYQSQIIFTHHPGDLNDDHGFVSRACMAASRLWQRQPGILPLKELYFMEILSSTEWGFPGHNALFQPDTFVELSESDLLTKIKSIDAYRNVMREVPHPRSPEVLTANARLRGSQSNCVYAEAFMRAYGGISILD